LKRIRYQSQPAQSAAAAGATRNAELAAVNRTGMLLGEETPVWGGIVARFRDIDGNTFSLVSFDELTPCHGSATPRRHRKAGSRAPHRSRTRNAKHVQSRLFHKFCRR